jgi:hypothetical protein
VVDTRYKYYFLHDNDFNGKKPKTCKLSLTVKLNLNVMLIINSYLFNEFVCKLGFFLFDEPLKGSKSLKIFKISLTFLFDKW